MTIEDESKYLRDESDFRRVVLNIICARLVIVGCVVVSGLAACVRQDEAVSLAKATEMMDKGNFLGATLELKTALTAMPNSGEARFRLGVALLELSDHRGALVEFEKAKALGYSEEKLAPKIARVWLFQGKYKEVVRTFGEVKIDLARDQAELFNAVAQAHGGLNQRESADSAIDLALKADPTFVGALLTKARFVAAAGNFNEAMALVDRAVIPGAQNGEALMLRGMFLRYVKQDEAGALKAFEQAANDSREVMHARSVLATMHIQRNRLAEAKQQVEALRKFYPTHPQTLYLDALVSYASRDFTRTAKICEPLLGGGLSNNTQILVLAGAADLQRGALLAAEAKLGRVVQTVEGATVARTLLAETYLRLGAIEKALQTLKPLLELPNPSAHVLELAAQSYLISGDFIQAEARFSAAAKLKPEDVRLRTSLALVELAKGNATSAIETLQTLAAGTPTSTADLALINTYLRKGDFSAALKAIAALEKKIPNRVEPSYLRATVLLRQGDRSGARAAFEAALKKQPDHFASIHALARLDEQDQDSAKAISRLESSVKANPQNMAARIALLDVMLRAKAKDVDIIAGIDAAISAAPAEPAPRIAKIVQLTRMGDGKGAAVVAHQALSAIPSDPNVLDAAGLALVAAGEEHQAISAFNKLATVSPNSAQPHLRLADIHAQFGRKESVISSLQRAADADPLSRDLHRRLLAHGDQSKDYKIANAVAEILQKRFSRRPEGYLLEGDLHMAQAKWELALGAYRLGMKSAPSSELMVRGIRAADRGGKRQIADALAAQWLDKNPNDAAFFAFLGDRSTKLNEFARAETYYLEALKIEPEQAAAANNLAWVKSKLRREDALTYAERAVKMRPDRAEFADTLAVILANQGELAKAIDWQRKAVANEPRNPDFKLGLARLLLQSGQSGEASRLLEELSKLGRSYPLHAEVDAMIKRAR